MSTRWARVSRGLLAAGFATMVAALFHSASGGNAPSALALSLSLAFSGIFCVALAGKRLSLWRLTASVAVSQLLFHALFSLGQGGGAVLSGGLSGGAVHGAHALHAGLGSVVAGGAAGTASVGISPSVHGTVGMLGDTPAMWAGHAAAALVTIVLLRHGEKTFWGVCQTALLYLGQFFDRVPTAPAPLVRLAHPGSGTDVPSMRDRAVQSGTLGLRGPPNALFV